jgi:F-type H+-transporting ATPase subunit gamma
MAQTLESLRTQIAVANDLYDAVSTMKALASVNIRQYEDAVRALDIYGRTIELGLQIVLMQMEGEINPTKLEGVPEPLGAIIFGSEQGFVGQFNERVAEFAVDRLRAFEIPEEDLQVLALGTRLSDQLGELGQNVDAEMTVPNALANVAGRVQDVLLMVDEWRTERNIERIIMFYNGFESVSSFRPTSRWLIPVDTEWLREIKAREWESRVIPTIFLDRERLLYGLIRQYLFVFLFRAFIESSASENASRLQSMESAEQNIEERLEELRASFQRIRQTSITEELLDIASGFEALGDEI